MIVLTSPSAQCAFAASIEIGPPWAASTINQAIAKAHDGDVVLLIGTGTTTWTDTVRIPGNKGISLVVANGTSGSWNGPHDGRVGTSFPITVTSNQATVIAATIGPKKSLVRISGFKFRGSPSLQVIWVNGQGKGNTYLGGYRIDNNYFDHVNSSSIVALDGSAGELTGLVDNNTFDNPNWDSYSIRVRETWKGASAACYGYGAWTRKFAFGENQFHFIEDNLFQNTTEYQRHGVSSDGAGGKFVVRYNTFISALPSHTPTSHGPAGSPDFIDAHGDGTKGLGTGARGGEIYQNRFLGSRLTVGRDINLRGGQWLVYDNTFATLGYSTSPVNLTEYRASTTSCWQMQYPSLCWPAEPQCATAENASSLYPLPGQIQGTYIWNNTYRGIAYGPAVDKEAGVPVYIQPKRDYWATADLAEAKSAGLSLNYRSYAYPHPLRNTVTGKCASAFPAEKRD
jgi:hypothetical protein